MLVSLIVAADENNLIGASGAMPWHLPDDLRHFRNMTTGKPIVMGRRTFEAIGRPLPNRDNLILTRNPDYRADGCRVVGAMDEVEQAVAGDCPELMVIGGAQIYALALPAADRIYLTRIHAQFSGDTWFPTIDPDAWEQVSCQHGSVDERNQYPHSFITLQRRS